MILGQTWVFWNKDPPPLPSHLNHPIPSNFYLDVRCGIHKLNKCHVLHIRIKMGGNWRIQLEGSFLRYFLVSGCASWFTYSTAVCCIHSWNLSRHHTSCLGLGSAYKWCCDRMWSFFLIECDLLWGKMWLLVSVFTSRINIFVLFIKLMLLFRYCVVQSALGECHHNSEFSNWWCYL